MKEKINLFLSITYNPLPITYYLFTYSPLPIASYY